MMFDAVVKNEGLRLTQALAVKPGDLFRCPDDVTHVARRDHAAFSVFLRADREIFLTLTTAAAFSPELDAMTIRAEADFPGLGRAEISSIGMVDDDDGTRIGDIQLQGDSFPLAGKRVHMLRLAVDIPVETPPGTYRGRIRFLARELFGDETVLHTLVPSVVVHDVVIPAPRERMFHLDLWQHLSNIARKHETALFSDAHFAVLEHYVASLARLGQKAVTVIASEIPWSGQRCFLDKEYRSDLFEYGMVRTTRAIDGSLSYDYTVFDRYVSLCLSYGIDREIEVFGLVGIWMEEGKGYGKAAPDWPDGIRIRVLEETDGTYRYLRKNQEISAYLAALQDHLDAKGWLDRTRIVADEPSDKEQYRMSLQAVRSAAPGFRFKTAINHASFLSEFQEEITDAVPILSAVSEAWDELQAIRSSRKGRRLYYVCCWPPYPNTLIGSPLAEGRLIPLLATYLGMDGFLRWNYAAWPENPRQRLSFRAGDWWSGDTCFVYPSRGGEPLLSLRYFALQRGLEDQELVRMLKEKPGGDVVLERIWSTLILQRDIRCWTYSGSEDPDRLFQRDWEVYDEMKRWMLEALES